MFHHFLVTEIFSKLCTLTEKVLLIISKITMVLIGTSFYHLGNKQRVLLQSLLFQSDHKYLYLITLLFYKKDLT